MIAIGIGLGITVGSGSTFDVGPPDGALPADAYQEPLANGDEGYWFSGASGYYQEPI